ncbi:hypothetical protein Bhyg_13246, partial [Pseudolycoriella hygida]
MFSQFCGTSDRLNVYETASETLMSNTSEE